MTDISIRPGTEGEQRLAIDSFVHEYAKAPAATGTPRGLLAALFVRLLQSWNFLVAVEPDADEVLGFIVYDFQTGRVAWLQVKAPYRRRGVGKALLESADICKGSLDVPFLPGRAFPKLAASKGYHLRFRPYLPIQ